jgi:hypothetical protein
MPSISLVSDNIISLDLIAEKPQCPKGNHKFLLHFLNVYCKVVIHNVTRAPPPKHAFLKQCHTMMHYVIRYDHWSMFGIYHPAVLLGGRQWYVHRWRKFDSIIRLPASSRLGVGKGNGGASILGSFEGEREEEGVCVSGRNITLECFQMKEFVRTYTTYIICNMKALTQIIKAHRSAERRHEWNLWFVYV